MPDGASGIMPRMSAAATPDETLLARFNAGDVAAFEELYARHERPLWRFIVRLCPDRASAEELLQETWFAVTREAARFHPEARFAPWLYAIARYRVIDRHRATRRTESLDAPASPDGTPLAEHLPDEHSPSPLAQSAQREQGAAILAALAQLPREQREVFVLQMETDLRIEDIAIVTGTTFETARSRLRYARDKLRALLKDHAP